MADVSKEAIADVNSTLKVEFPISSFQDVNAVKKNWTLNEKTRIIPDTCELIYV
jgi:hypothetical protein